MMYIRTKDGRIGKVISVRDYNGGKPTFYHVQFENDKEIYNDYELDIIKQTYTLKELCDEFVIIGSGKLQRYKKPTLEKAIQKKQWLNRLGYKAEVYGAIWTDKGLIYVAKMNGKGELELL